MSRAPYGLDVEAAKPKLSLSSDPDHAARGAIFDELIAHNVGRAGPHGRTPLAVLMEHADTGEVIGGRWGRTSWRWLTIETLFVPEAHRGAGLGSEIVGLAEREAVRRGCVDAWVDTHSFQAPGFYERMGYRRLGEIEDYPPGHARVFVLKRF